MKDKTGTVPKALRDGTILYEDGVTVITEDTTRIGELRMIDELMNDIAKRGSLIFYRGTVRGHMVPIASPIGKRLMNATRIDLAGIRKAFPLGRFSPYFYWFEDVLSGFELPYFELDAGSFHRWDELAQVLKQGMNTPGFREKRRAHERNVRKNFVGLVRYLRDLMSFNSKLLVVRVDVGYKLEHTKAVAFEEFQRHKDQLLQYVKRSGNGAFLGSVWKLEHGDSRGYHAHLLCLYNGQKLNQDVTIGLAIGQHWVREVTGGRGWTHNCNAQKERYRYLGIGTINYFNDEARQSLERVAAYLTKPDYHIRLVAPAGARLFGRTGFPRTLPERMRLALRRRRAAARRALALARAKRVDKRERKRIEDLAGLQAPGLHRRTFSAMFPRPHPVMPYKPVQPCRGPGPASQSTCPADSEATHAPPQPHGSFDSPRPCAPHEPDAR